MSIKPIQLSQSAIYTFKQMNNWSLISAKEMCKNHIQPVEQIKQHTTQKSHVSYSYNEQSQFLLKWSQKSQHCYWYYKTMSSDDNIKTYQPKQAKIKLCNTCRLIIVDDAILKYNIMNEIIRCVKVSIKCNFNNIR